MGDSDEIKKIIEKAEKTKRKKRIEALRSQPVPRRVKPPSVTPPDDERWDVHRTFALTDINWFRWLLPLGFIMLPVSMCGGKQLTEGQSWVCVALLAAIPVGRFIFAWLHALVTFRRFRTWRSRLPFKLTGWEKLVDAEHFTRGEYWRLEGSVELELSSHPVLNSKAVSALLYLFCNEANREFYVPEFSIGGFSGDPRREWTVNGTAARGSVNTGVACQIYRFLDRQLAPLAAKHGVTGKVTITVSDSEYEISPEPISSEGTAS